jgi:PEP-CTERM motif
MAKDLLRAAVCTLSLVALAPMAQATTVAEIGAGYSTTCDLDPTCAAALTAGATFQANLALGPNNLGTEAAFVEPISGWDDPSLFIYNLTAFSFSNAKLVGRGYQGSNIGIVQTAPGLATTIGSNTVYQYSWPGYPYGAYCGLGAGSLFTYDYDDEYGCSGAARPGNVELIFSAHWNNPAYNSGAGIDVSTVIFSPNSNLTSAFFGFEGLDQYGFAETSWDAHTNSPGAYVANINIGSAQTFNAPEPITLTLFGAGLAGAAALRRRKKKVA